ncbi:unnamed protein product, partial [Brachionus calyciflorus]
MYKCNFDECSFKSHDIEKLIDHIYLLHSKNSSTKLKCVFTNCKLQYTTFRCYANHLRKKHEKKVESVVFYQCINEKCRRKYIESIQSLIIHYMSHFDNEDTFYCIFKECEYSTKSRSGFSTHLSRYHPIKLAKNIRENFKFVENHFSNEDEFTNNNNFDSVIDSETQSEPNDHNETINNILSPEFYDQEKTEEGSSVEKEIGYFYIKNYLKYKDQKLIP